MILALALLLHATPEGLDNARKLFADALWAETITVLDNLLARTDLTPAQRSEGLFMAGSSHLALAHDAAARLRYVELLSSDSDYPLPPYTPRKVRALFEQIRQEQKDAPTLVAKPPSLEGTATGDKLRLHFGAERLQTHRALAHWRRAGQAKFTALPLTGTAALTAAIPLPPGVDVLTLEYYAEVSNTQGVVLARAGNALQPFVFTARRTEIRIVEDPAYKKTWFWVVIGAAAVAVAGGSVAAYYLLAPAPSNAGTLTVKFGAGR